MISFKNKHALLLTNFDFIDIIHLSLGKKNRGFTIFWDPFRSDLGVLVSALIFFIGRRKSGVLIKKIGSLLKLDILPVPHGDVVPDYHFIQIQSEIETTEYLTQDYETTGLVSTSYYQRLGLDEFCVRSLDLKRSGLIISSLVENLKVLDSLECKSVEVVVCRGEIPTKIVEEILERNQAVIRFRLWRLDLISIIGAITMLSGKVMSLLCRSLLPVSFNRVDLPENGMIAVEYVDPRCSSGGPTEPNFLTTIGINSDKIIAYVRSGQAARNGPKRNFVLQEPISVVFVDELPVPVHCFKVFFLAGKSLLGNVIHNRCSFRRFMIDLSDLLNWVEFTTFLSIYKPAAHVYNTIPNGKTGTRFDSGIYTGACRNSNCVSVSYQSRVQYRRKLYYFFEVFDKFYYWGSAWQKDYSYPQFVTDSISLGFLGKKLDYKAPAGSTTSSRKVAVFLSDIDTEHPLHYTLNYTIIFLTEVFQTIFEFNKSTEEKLEILLKPKDPEHWKILLNTGLFKKFLEDDNLHITAKLDARHSISDTLNMADKVISIGFTTPGIDALSMNIPSIYFTPYTGIYNNIFDDPGSPLVANNRESLLRFLREEVEVNESFRCSILGDHSNRTEEYFVSELGKLLS